MSDTVQQVKDKLSIIDVVSGYVKLDRAGSSLRARCPFHSERTPSFHVSADRGTYHCFGCGVGGDIFSFVEAIEGVDFKGALKILAEKAGVPLVYERGGKSDDDERDRLFSVLEQTTLWYQTRLSSEAKEYLIKRGLSEETVSAFRLGLAEDGWSDLIDHLKKKGFSDKELLDSGVARKNEKGGLADKFRNRIMFPIADNAGRIVAFSGRTFGEKAHPDAPKYLNSPETLLFRKSRILHGFDRAKQYIRKNNFAVLVEGQMDLLASHQAGWPNTVAVSGTAFTQEHALLIKRMTENVLLALDADEAGIKAASRAARIALAEGLNVKVATLPDGLDPADLILKSGADAWRGAIREAKDIITFLLDVLESRLSKRDQFRRAVETVVLPFILDVRSPIAREQYVREIAERLGVSEQAVVAAAGRVPMPAPQNQVEARDHKLSNREEQAYAILLWQEFAAKPLIDVPEYSRTLQDSLGSERYQRLQALPETDKERLRFIAEQIYGTSQTLTRDTEQITRVLQKDRLSIELTEVTVLLKQAEAAGDSALMETLTQKCKELSSRIAQS